MFEAPAIISFICDAFTIVVYFNSPSLFGETHHKSILDINPLRSVFTLVIAAGIHSLSSFTPFTYVEGLRMVLFLPYVWRYQHDRHLQVAQVPYFWVGLNVVLIALKAIWELSRTSWQAFLWVMLLGSTISVICQVF
jgi:hypothetical protein